MTALNGIIAVIFAGILICSLSLDGFYPWVFLRLSFVDIFSYAGNKRQLFCWENVENFSFDGLPQILNIQSSVELI